MEDSNYDVIICGTGIIQGILSSLLAMEGKKVIQIDSNPHYGGDGQCVNIFDLWRIFRPNQKHPDDLGKNRDWNIDLIPKFMLSNGRLMKLLAKTKVLKYLELKYIDENLIYSDKTQEKLLKIPTDNDDNYFQNEEQRINYQKFIEFISQDNQQEFNLNQISFNELANKFNLDQQNIELVGKMLAFQLNDDYLNQPANLTVEKIKLYLQSKNKNSSSPFVYPIYGLGGLPEGFSRLVAIYGGTVMLDVDIDEILFDKGQVSGIKSAKYKEMTEYESINAPILIADPSHASHRQLKRVNNVGKIIRCVCILNHPIPGYDNQSLSINIPNSQTGRKNDIYITILDESHFVQAIITNIETNDPEKELEAGFNLINPVLEKFINVSDVYIQNEQKNNLYFTNSYNATNVLDTEIDQVFEIYKQITGKNLDLNDLDEQ
ncbi:hypothetical protein pb186bvf_019420 [Paramecium bursaria]